MKKGSSSKFMVYLTRLFLLLLMWSSLETSAYAAQQIGVVIAAVGKASAGARSLSRRSPIYQGDTITTAAGGKISFKFTDGSVMTLRENSSFNVASYSFKNGKTPDTFDAKLIKGGLQTVTGKIGKEAQHTNAAKAAGIPENQQVAVGHYKIQAATTTIGVRGTKMKIAFPKSVSWLENDDDPSKLFISALTSTVEAHLADGDLILLGDGGDYSYIEIFTDGDFNFLTSDPIPDGDFDVGGDDEEDDDDDDDDDDNDDDNDDDSDDEGGDESDDSGSDEFSSDEGE